jgi:hypothetical protein
VQGGGWWCDRQRGVRGEIEIYLELTIIPRSTDKHDRIVPLQILIREPRRIFREIKQDGEVRFRLSRCRLILLLLLCLLSLECLDSCGDGIVPILRRPPTRATK